VLQQAADDVAYEIETLLAGAERTGEIIHSSPMSGDPRIALEAFLLHFRNLVEFLCPDPHALDQRTVIGSDFLDKEKPENVARKDVLWRDKSRINALLAHISYGRAGYKDRNQMAWHVERMCREVVEGLQEFISKLSDERRAWFLRHEGVRKALSENVARIAGSIADTCTTTMVTTAIVDIGERATEHSSDSTQATCKPPSETR
jgi:hypothetical protein